MKTHYEIFSARIAPHRHAVKQFVDLLAQDTRTFGDVGGFPREVRGSRIASEPGLWPMFLLPPHGGRYSNGKKKMELIHPGIGVSKIAGIFDAFFWEIFSRIYAAAANEDGSWSIGNALFVNKDFAIIFKVLSTCGFAAQSMSEIAYHGLSHERIGKRVYDVSPGLAEKLKYTELRGLTSEDMRLPFPSIYIAVPPEAEFKIYNDLDHQWHALEGVYITEDNFGLVEPEPPHSVYANPDLSIECSDGIALHDRKRSRSLSIMFVGAAGKDAQGNTLPNDDALFFFRLYLGEMQTVEQALQTTHRRNRSYKNNTLLDLMDRAWEDIFKWCLNVIMYATCVSPGEAVLSKEARKIWQRIERTQEGSRKRKHLEQKLASLEPRRVVLGRHITVDRTRPEAQGEGGVPGHKITVRTRVAGHWRRVRCGPKWESTRMVFVEPFWRGPELGEEVASKHVLK